MSRRRRGSNPRSTHEEGYDEYSHDDEDEWDESEEDHTTSSPSIPSRDQHDELAEEGVTRFFESEDDDSDGDEALNSPPLDTEQSLLFNAQIKNGSTSITLSFTSSKSSKRVASKNH